MILTTDKNTPEQKGDWKMIAFFLFFFWLVGRIIISPVILCDLFIPDRWTSPTTFEKVTFSPSQKGLFESPGGRTVCFLLTHIHDI